MALQGQTLLREEIARGARPVGMNFNPDTTRAMAHERFRDFERRADDGLLDEPRSHTSLVSRMRERMPFVLPRDRRAYRPAASSS